MRARKSLNELSLCDDCMFWTVCSMSRVQWVRFALNGRSFAFRMQLDPSLILLLFKIYTFWKCQLFLINFSHLRMLQIMIIAAFYQHLASSSGILPSICCRCWYQCRICLHSMNLQLNRNEAAGAANWRFGNISIVWKRIHCRLIASID